MLPKFRCRRISATGAKTSRPIVPGVFRAWQAHGDGFSGLNFDVGGGKYDKVQEWFAAKGIGCTNLVYDPHNRSPLHNREVLKAASACADSVTVANVLNILCEAKKRKKVLWLARRFAKPGCAVLIQCYRDRKGRTGYTRDGFQWHQPIGAYLDEVRKVFPGAVLWRGYILARGGGSSDGRATDF